MKKEIWASLVLLSLGLIGVSIPVVWHFLGPKKNNAPPRQPGTLQVAVTPAPAELAPDQLPAALRNQDVKPAQPMPAVDAKLQPEPKQEVKPKQADPETKKEDPTKDEPKKEVTPPVKEEPKKELSPPVKEKPVPPPVVDQRPPAIAKLPPAKLDQFRHVKQHELIDPDGEFTVPNLNDKSYFKLIGKVKTLVVGQVDSQSFLDASGLEAKEIIVRGGVNSQSTVKLNAPGGKVEFKGIVDSASKVEVNAAAGTVDFRSMVNSQSRITVSAPGGTVTFGKNAFIDGVKTAITLTAKQVEFGHWVNGTTLLDVTLTRDGQLKFTDMRGQSRLLYRRADLNDPLPTLFPGKIERSASVRLDERPAANQAQARVFDPAAFRKVEEKNANDPRGELNLGNIDTRKLVKLTGTIKTLRIGFIDNESVLDASGLQVEQVIFQDRVSGKSTVILNSAGAKIEFRNMVSAHAQLDINVPDGSVTFKKHAAGINGESQVKIVSRDVAIDSNIVGGQTRVDVTLTSKGRLTYKDLEGGAQLNYRLFNAGDPDPLVKGGQVRGNAKVNRVN